MDRIDLHTHSTASDGTLTPQELATAAKNAGLKACAITDHDTVSGVEKFLETCKKEGIEGIPGIEISAEYSGEMHIVGLYIDYKDEQFKKKLYSLEHSREIRNIRMVEKCCSMGFEMTVDELLEQKENASLDSIGRPHFAKVFIKRGFAKTKDEVFDKYIGKGKPCYVERKLYSPKETIELIKKAGGIAILAHPIFISRDRDKLVELLTELKSYGLDGTECIYSEYDEAFSEMIFGICDRLDLLPSGGSDFHGKNKPDIAIADGRGELCVPYDILERIKTALSGPAKK